MQVFQMKFPKHRIFIIAVVVAIAVNVLTVLISLGMYGSWHQNEIIDTTHNYINFQHRLTDLMETGAMLLTGYEAYLNVNGVLSNEESEEFLSQLTEDEISYIRNIGIIKDTTIIYNFPLKENEASIGVDLAQVEGQRDVILRTKDSMKGSFQGPVDLVQGGRGFIMRIPISDNQNMYWGQVSIVLKAEEIISSIQTFEKTNDLSVNIYEDGSRSKLVYGEKLNDVMSPLVFDVNTDLNDWVIYVQPIGGWDKFTQRIALVVSGGFLLSMMFAFIAYHFLKMNYNLKYALAHDHLTGLYNRYFLEKVQEDMLRKALNEHQRFGVMHIDLDYFKDINDKYGHDIGDAVLVETARLLKKLTRDNELVFRIGGDEFLVMLNQIESKEALVAFKERLKSDFNKEYSLRKYEIDIGPSIGVGVYPDDGEDFDTVLRTADIDMYLEKGENKR